MTILALGTGAAILAWITVVVALVGALAAIVLLNRVVGPAGEIEAYADDVLEAGLAIARNLDGLEELGDTRRIALAAPDLVGGYVGAPGRGS